MKMNIVVCDNQLDYLNAIGRRISDRFKDEELPMKLYQYSTSQELHDSFKKLSYDLAYVEMTMEDNTGIEIAKAILKDNPKCIVIFVSHESIRIEEALRLGAFQYIFKPIDTQIFNKELDSAIEKYKTIDKKFFLHTSQGKNIIFKVSSIIYVETYYNDLEIVTTYKKYRSDVKQKYRLRPILRPRQFLQVNQSVLVNMDYIELLTEKCVILKTGEVFNISLRHTTAIHLKYQSYLMKRKENIYYEISNYR